MGLFDNIFNNQPADKPLGKAEAFAGILLAASACDGDIADEEARGLTTITERMRLFDDFTPQRWKSVLAGLGKALKRDGVNTLVERCARALPEELRETAFANACDVILADGIVEKEEKAFLDNLQKLLTIDGDTALTIVEVMIIKNKG
jgi:tellurite resistance protein